MQKLPTFVFSVSPRRYYEKKWSARIDILFVPLYLDFFCLDAPLALFMYDLMTLLWDTYVKMTKHIRANKSFRAFEKAVVGLNYRYWVMGENESNDWNFILRGSNGSAATDCAQNLFYAQSIFSSISRTRPAETPLFKPHLIPDLIPIYTLRHVTRCCALLQIVI